MKNKGLILLNVLVFAVIAITVTLALTNWAASTAKNLKQLTIREQALHVAEAGIDYYRWHLDQDPEDYTDGNGPEATGPFVHDFEDKAGNVIGQFSLTIEPVGGSVGTVIVTSKGTMTANPSVSRTIQATLGASSLARYFIAANDNLTFTSGVETRGRVHSNKGIHFNGIAYSPVTSSKAKYVDPDNGAAERFGVYTTSGADDPSPPAAVPPRSDVFRAGRTFPVAEIDFSALTEQLIRLKTAAQASGRYFPASGEKGYHVILKTNGTFDLYIVEDVTSPSTKCEKEAADQGEGWGTWTIKNSHEEFVDTYSFPATGAIFFEDHVWVDGSIDGARLTIGAGTFPGSSSTWKNIIVNEDVLYTNYNGEDVLGLVAQGNVHLGLESSDDLRIDAALVAQNGRVGRYRYHNSCGAGHDRQSFTLYGMIATNFRHVFAYTDGTGYDNRNLNYDPNLLFAPPPYFPLLSSRHHILSWDEVK